MELTVLDGEDIDVSDQGVSLLVEVLQTKEPRVVLEGLHSRQDRRAIGTVEPPIEDVSLLLADVTEGTAWLTLSAFAPPGTNVAALGGELRERAIAALAREQLLPV